MALRRRQGLALGSTRSTPDGRLVEALKYLGHWFGDIHQPSHVSFETGPAPVTSVWTRASRKGGGGRPDLSRDYTPTVGARLVKSGIRLGGLLNEFPSHGLREVYLA
jgi:hypothetical protein